MLSHVLTKNKIDGEKAIILNPIVGQHHKEIEIAVNEVCSPNSCYIQTSPSSLHPMYSVLHLMHSVLYPMYSVLTPSNILMLTPSYVYSCSIHPMYSVLTPSMFSALTQYSVCYSVLTIQNAPFSIPPFQGSTPYRMYSGLTPYLGTPFSIHPKCSPNLTISATPGVCS